MSQIILTKSLSSAVSSFLLRPVRFKFCIKNEKTTTKLIFSASSGLYFLYETSVNKFLNFTFVLLYFVFVCILVFLERRYRPEKDLGSADFLAVVTYPIVCSEVFSCPHFLLPP